MNRPQASASCETLHGGIIRGPKDRKHVALVFTAHEFAEGADTILADLARHRARASFFLTGVFLTNAQFAPLVVRLRAEGHYLGPHSDRHLLYCDWDKSRTTRVTRAEFQADLSANLAKLPEPFSQSRRTVRYFLPAFEHYNSDIAAWTKDLGCTLINFTPGTRSNADYTGEADPNFVSSRAILDSIVKHEREDPHGLNGFILLFHLGSGPGRSDKFDRYLGTLLDHLEGKGYQFIRVDELLEREIPKAK